MLMRISHAPDRWRWLAVLLVLTAFVSTASAIQTTDAHETERKQAFALANEGKFVEAVPLLKKLLQVDPNDARAAFNLGLCLQWTAKLQPDAAARKQMRALGYAYLKQAQELGLKDVVLDGTLAALKPDGGDDPAYSANPLANQAMIQAEAAFGGGQLDEAFAAYQQALTIDPKLYEAALFAGDALYKGSTPEKAGDWYAKAIAIDPNREIAYRYWADSLMSLGKSAEARDKYVEAFISEPYNKLATQALIKWADKAHVTLVQPKIEIPVTVTRSEKGQPNITLDSNTLLKRNATAADWIVYGGVRSQWMNDKFSAQFPNEKQYRHSLPEEAEALSSVARMATDAAKGGEVKGADESMTNLLRLYKAGLIEPYVLLARPDAGIAQDYSNYRKSNRDKLRRYVNEFIILESH
jgi:tetratricopeptide (TPR) repeat protein